MYWHGITKLQNLYKRLRGIDVRKRLQKLYRTFDGIDWMTRVQNMYNIFDRIDPMDQTATPIRLICF